MTIRTLVSMKSLHFPAIRLPKWPDFNLGKRLVDMGQAYSRALSIAHLTALGLESDASATRERIRWDNDH